MLPASGTTALLLLLHLLAPVSSSVALASKPNFVIFFGDDWGWGDLGENNEEVRGLTPNLDQLAREGLRCTNFHVGASVCTPSRAALLTGRIGPRTGVTKNFGPSSSFGLPLTERTIAEVLKDGGWRTGMVGKWHLGTANGHHPRDRGFDWYVGLPYSDDMGCGATPTSVMAPQNPEQTIFCPACPTRFNQSQDCQPDHSCGRSNGCFGQNMGVPLFHNRTIVAQPVDLGRVSENYTGEVREFLVNAAAAPEPFFLYYAASHVHVPQNHAPKWDALLPDIPFAHREGGGTEFAAALMEMDDEMGNLMRTLRVTGEENNTLIMVTGDNGNWECKCNLTGSHGPYAGQWQKNQPQGGSSSKCSLWEAGHREVGIYRWLGRIQAGGVTGAILSSMDFLPTIAALSGLHLPTERDGQPLHFDGMDVSAVLFQSNSQRASQPVVAHTKLFHPACACGSGQLLASRMLHEGKEYKAMFVSGGVAQCGGHTQECTMHDPPLLFELSADPGEAHALDTAKLPYSRIVAMMVEQRANYQADINSTARSITNYASSAAGRSANCCDSSNPACACTKPSS